MLREQTVFCFKDPMFNMWCSSGRLIYISFYKKIVCKIWRSFWAQALRFYRVYSAGDIDCMFFLDPTCFPLTEALTFSQVKLIGSPPQTKNHERAQGSWSSTPPSISRDVLCILMQNPYTSMDSTCQHCGQHPKVVRTVGWASGRASNGLKSSMSNGHPRSKCCVLSFCGLYIK